MHVLYLFAGTRRKSGLAGALRRAVSGTQVRVVVQEVDTLQGGRQHDLLQPALQKNLMEKVLRGDFYMVVASPPCSTFAGKK